MKPSIKLADLSRQHEPLKAELAAAIEGVVKRGEFILGPEVAAFEEEFAAYCGVRRAVGVDSGSSALELALRSIGLESGDEVIVPAFTFVATAWAVKAAGAKPVFADVDSETMLLDPEKAAETVGPTTKAVVPVHLFGYPIDIESLRARLPGRISILEDACQAHGASSGKLRAGAAGRMGAFSFYPSKNLGAMGDAGMVVTNDEALAEEVKALRNYGRDRRGEYTRPAMNRRMDSLQAAVLKVKLRHLDEWNDQRRAAAAIYRRELAGSRLVFPPEPAEGSHCYHTFTVRSAERDSLVRHLADCGIETRIHYNEALNRLPVLGGAGDKAVVCPVAERLAKEVLSLPMFPGIRRDEIASVAAAVKKFEERGKR